MKFLRLLLVVAFASLAGCASFPQHQVPMVTQMPDPSHVQYKPTVQVNLKFYYGATEMRHAEDQLLPVVKETVLKSGLFNPTDYGVGDKTDLVVNVFVKDTGDEGLAMVSGFITGFTFGVIPGGATDNYAVQVDVLDGAGKPLTTAANQDSMTTYVGWVFLPWAGHTPAKASKETIGNQIRAALMQEFESGKLTVAPPANAPTAAAR